MQAQLAEMEAEKHAVGGQLCNSVWSNRQHMGRGTASKDTGLRNLAAISAIALPAAASSFPVSFHIQN